MPKFRKKPVEIEAWQVPAFEFGDPVGAWNATIPQWLADAETAGTVRVIDKPAESDWARIEIETLEGTMTAHPGDWIIKGIKGELYPCKPDIFAATYDEVVTQQHMSIDELEKILQQPDDPTVKINTDGSVTRAVR